MKFDESSDLGTTYTDKINISRPDMIKAEEKSASIRTGFYSRKVTKDKEQ